MPTSPDASPKRRGRRRTPDASQQQQQHLQEQYLDSLQALDEPPRRSARLASRQAGSSSGAAAGARSPSRVRRKSRSSTGPEPGHAMSSPHRAEAQAAAAHTGAAAARPRALLPHAATNGAAAVGPSGGHVGAPPQQQQQQQALFAGAAAAGLQHTPKRQRRHWAARGQSALKVAWEHALLGYDDIPEWMRDNSLILTGYRPQMTLAHALGSLFSLHNETVNTWSHIAGALIMMYLMVAWYHTERPAFPHPVTGAPREAHAATPAKWPLMLFLLANLYVYVVSSSAHLLHVVSKPLNDILWKMDHLGIAVGATCSFFPICLYVFACREGLAELYVCVTCFLASAVIAMSTLDFFHKPKYRTLRAAVQLSFPLWAQLPLMHAAYLMTHSDAFGALMRVYLSIGIIVVGTVIFASRVTESLFPGRVDIFGSSHQIMHVTVVISHVLFFQGGRDLWLWRSSSDGACH